MISSLLASMRGERWAYVLWAMGRLLWEQLLGRCHAALLGWRHSFLGRGSRVIGSRHVQVHGRAYINRDAWIEAVHSFRGVRFSPVIQIGHGFSASDRLHISCVNRVDIGPDCLFGSGVYISDHNHGIYHGPQQSSPDQAPVDRALETLGKVTIGARVWLGDNVVIVGPVCIGDGAVIGANSVVRRDIPANCIAFGAPAEVRRRFNTASASWEVHAR